MLAAPTRLREPFGTIMVAILAMMALFLISAPAVAQAPQGDDQAVALPQGNAHLQPFDTLKYLIDESERLDPAEALSRRAEFQDLNSPWVDFGNQKGAVWLLVKVTNTSDRPGRWMIDVQRPFVDELLVQKRSADTAPETLLAADRSTPFDERPVVS
ncbi:MAG: 7TM-DISM domain-containing protein, partial [Pseudomonadota bacterium]